MKAHIRQPSYFSRFIGRQAEMRAMGELYREGAYLVSLLGPGGVGKTRLALEFSRQLDAWLQPSNNARGGGQYALFSSPTSSTAHPKSPDSEAIPDEPPAQGNIWFFDFSEARSVNDFFTVIALSLGLPLTEADSFDQLIAAVEHGAPRLVICDNFETLSQLADATLVPLMRACKRRPTIATRWLVTTRERLRIDGEWVFEVSPLALPEGDHRESLEENEAVQLLVERARQQRPEMQLEEMGVDSVVRLVRYLDGFPLAIELAASRLGLLSVDELLDELRARASPLKRPGSKASRRHQSMDLVIDESWQAMTPWERIVAVQCSCFVGKFDLTAARAVLELGQHDEEVSVLDALQTLRDKSILAVSSQQGTGRQYFQIYQVLADFLEGIRAESEEWKAVYGEAKVRHTRYYGELGRVICGDDPWPKSPFPRDLARSALAQYPNFMAVLYRQGLVSSERLQSKESPESREMISATYRALEKERDRDDVHENRPALASWDIPDDLDDPQAALGALLGIFVCHSHYLGRIAQCIEILESAERFPILAPTASLHCAVLVRWASLLTTPDAIDRAQVIVQRIEASADEHRLDAYRSAIPVLKLSLVFHQGQVEDALNLLAHQEAGVWDADDSSLGLGYWCDTVAHIFAYTEDVDRAVKYLERGRSIAETHDHQELRLRIAFSTCQSAVRRREDRQALELAQQGLHLAKQHDNPLRVLAFESLMARLVLYCGDADEAMQLIEAGVDKAQKMAQRALLHEFLTIQAELFVWSTPDPERVVALTDEVIDWHDPTKVFHPNFTSQWIARGLRLAAFILLKDAARARQALRELEPFTTYYFHPVDEIRALVAEAFVCMAEDRLGEASKALQRCLLRLEAQKNVSSEATNVRLAQSAVAILAQEDSHRDDPDLESLRQRCPANEAVQWLADFAHRRFRRDDMRIRARFCEVIYACAISFLPESLRLDIEGRACDPKGQCLLLTEDLCHFRAPGASTWADIGPRKVLRRFVQILTQRHREERGEPVPIATLHEWIWPGEFIAEESLNNRLYTASSTLRRMGLDGILLKEADGYLIAPQIEIRLVSAPTQN